MFGCGFFLCYDVNEETELLIYAFFLTMPLAEAFGQHHLYILKAEVNAFLMSKGM